MRSLVRLCRYVTFLGVAILSGSLFTSILVGAQNDEAKQEKSAEPWTSVETTQPPDLAREIADAKPGNSPTIIYVGFRTLFEGGHIPGAVFHGTASTEKGLAELKTWLDSLPRSTNIVIYCGCCPFVRCPNIRPAYKTLHEMGFTRVRVLILTTSFAADWVDKGYPMQKGL